MGERVVRRARAADRDAFVALRAAMFEAMGVADAEGERWREAAAAWFDATWDSPDIALFVAEVGGEVVASAMATLRRVVPSPGAAGGRQVLVHNVCTLPHARGHGHAQAVFDALMVWVREESGAEGAELFATGQGRGMYERVGFREVTFPAMRLSLGER
ncbi:GNAT family N-acetyltransferase [Luteipulveratus sp. YIM 133132]|uniref:GNAT family N-acetyltransferase n=1 Tax=Luteipulveratus flavus TaxID=3031728 RepID=UPI0023B105A1|nr:GNAT family N-acetyltransferase [Luteipulveratus sp. YIM 133132]MDE9367274.1 GNAT family N-acetyltransferase [Luteipulveratus sp. YIM 133132]